MAAETCSTKQSITSAGSSDELGAKVDPELYSLIWNILNDKKRPLQQCLCSLFQTFLKNLDCQGNDTVNTSEYSVMEASLEFLSKIVMNALRGSQNPPQSSWEGCFLSSVRSSVVALRLIFSPKQRK